jgi:hypothetical protein
MRRYLFVLIAILSLGGGGLALARLTRCHSAGGAVAGNFDPVMSGVCRYACATKIKYQQADVIAQPGARPGKLTQCPVSGVVFAVDGERPRLEVQGRSYVACCANCLAKLQANPAQYLKS